MLLPSASFDCFLQSFETSVAVHDSWCRRFDRNTTRYSRRGGNHRCDDTSTKYDSDTALYDGEKTAVDTSEFVVTIVVHGGTWY
jgi:hypothetical protein